MPNEKHLEFVQQTIARMAGNSFLLKGWSVTLTAGLFALAAKDSDPSLAMIAWVPASAFWALDAYYLRQERLFRALYDTLRTQDEDFEFSMETSKAEPEKHVQGWFRTLFTRSVIGLHGVLLASIGVVFAMLTSP